MVEVLGANLAGRWYEADPSLLRANLERWVAGCPSTPGSRPPSYLLVPHAGHMWSGSVAGVGFARLAKTRVHTVIVLAPTHRESFEGVSLPPRDLEAFETPLGRLAVDRELARELEAAGPPFVFCDKALTREHAVEVQLPFVAEVAPEARVLPLVCGRMDPKSIKAAGRALGQVLEEGMVMVVSSDLTHYGSGFDFEPFGPGSPATLAQVETLDRAGLEFLERCDPEGWLDYQQEHGWTACGAVPAAVGMWALPPHSDGTVLQYATSAEISGDYERSVSYAAAEVSSEQILLSRRTRAYLRRAAARAVFETVGAPVEPEPDPAVSKRLAAKLECGAFVTLKVGGKLRGCTGSTASFRPLDEEIVRIAARTCTSDPRFPALAREELEDLELTVSVLSHMRQISSIDEAIVPHHGLYVVWRDRSGLLLPQVAREYDLARDEFLERTLAKAGVPSPLPDDAKLHVFTANVF